MIRRPWLPALLLLLAAPASAGLFGSDAPGRIPVPARPFRAEVEDVGGVVLSIDRVTFDGEVFLYGRIGAAQVTVPFERVAEATFSAGADEDHRAVTVTDRDGGSISLVVESDLPIQGRTSFGNYRIEASDVRTLRVTAVPE